jgi:hypothetical protein
MEQEVRLLKIKELVLWTENPRDPIDANAKDQEIVDRALGEQATKWSITQLAREMGKRYDFSELPTVVYRKNKPVVYDGNRRIMLGKIKLGLVKVDGFDPEIIPAFPPEIPCNVCVESIALDNVLRKHADSGSWKPLERDVFLHKYMRQPKSTFLLLEENTGLISANNHLNQVFVKNEIFREDTLDQMGFRFEGEKLFTVHNNEQAKSILSDLSKKIENKAINTRVKRGRVLEVLDKKSLEIIDDNLEGLSTQAKISFKSANANQAKAKLRLTKRRQKNVGVMFGGKLYLKLGVINELHRDISDLSQYFAENAETLSETFPNIIRMSLRLLCEVAAVDLGLNIDPYIKKYFKDGKAKLSQSEKTLLSNQNVKEESLIQLLHSGAHSYPTSSNFDQTIAMSIILGEMLEISHGKQ